MQYAFIFPDKTLLSFTGLTAFRPGPFCFVFVKIMNYEL